MVETGVGGRSKVKVSSTKEGYAHRRDTDFRIHRNFTNLVSEESSAWFYLCEEFSDELEEFEKQSVS